MSRSNAEVWTERHAYPEEVQALTQRDFIGIAVVWMYSDPRVEWTFQEIYTAMIILRPVFLLYQNELSYLGSVVDIQRHEIEGLTEELSRFHWSKS